jgi:hypothetical protein
VDNELGSAAIGSEYAQPSLERSSGMKQARDLTCVGSGEAPPSPPDLASWYAPGLSDALGDRLLMFDNTHAPSLELLRIRSGLASTPGFERALRERVRSLADFLHESFARVRTVERLEPDGELAVVSNHTAGRRLSEVLKEAQGPAFATALVRQLTPALADLQQHADGIAHGALSADRIIVTPTGRLVIVEHVLGSALEILRLPSSRLIELGIPVPPTRSAARLDGRTDFFQLGAIAVSLLLGRRLNPDEYPRVELLLDQLAQASHYDPAAHFPFLRHWIERALQLDGGAFESASDALEALDGLAPAPSFVEGHDEAAHRRLVESNADGRVPSALGALAPAAAEGGVRSEIERRVPSNVEAPVPNNVDGPVPSNVEAPVPNKGEAIVPSHVAEPVSRNAEGPAPGATARPPQRIIKKIVPNKIEEPVQSRIETPVPSKVEGPQLPAQAADSIANEENIDARGIRQVTFPTNTSGAQAAALQSTSPVGRTAAAVAGPATTNQDAATSHRTKSAGRLIAALTLLASAEAGVIAALLYRGWVAPEQSIVVEASDPGARVIVDRRAAGRTPVQLPIPFGTTSIRVVTALPGQATRTNELATNGDSAPRPTDARPGDRPAGASSPRMASIQLSSPIAVEVFAGNRLLGSAPGKPLLLAPGRHELQIVNTALGYRSRQTVDLKPGQAAQLSVSPPKGRVSINAVPWAEVSIDGKTVGETPLGNVAVPIGEHEFTFRHPKLGERRQKAIVRSEGVTRVTADLQR